MTNMVCRLCLSEEKLINIFDSRLTNSEQLRKCVLLGAGVEIRLDDIVTKYVCQYCSEVAILLYKYRKKAVANDRALKELAKQNFSEPPTNTKDIVELNRNILDELTKEDENIFVDNKDKAAVPKRVDTPNLAVHPTIIQLIKMYPKLKIPNDILKCDVQPSILLDRSEAEDWTCPLIHKEIEYRPETSAIERFKLMCPQISIKKVSQETTATKTQSPVNSVSVAERKTSDSPCSIASSVSKRKRCDSTTSESSTKSAKRRLESPIISSTNSDKQMDKLVINLSKPSSETPPVQETCNRTPPSIPTPIPTDVVDINHESNSEQIIPKILTSKKRILSDTDDSDYQPDPGASDDSDLGDNLLDTIDEEIVINCTTCNKMFNTRQQLRNHERVHRQCTICNGIFRTNEILRYHQQEICFKRIIVNSPKLELTRVDEMPEVVMVYPNAFNPEQEDTFEIKPRSPELAVISDDDDDVILIEDDKTTTNTQNAFPDTSEYQHIRGIFQKYHKLHMSVPKHKNTETKPRICIKYNSKNQIVLENMYPELQIYRVPVELIAKPTSFAYISFSKKQAKPKDIYCWANEPVIGCCENKKLLTALLTNKLTVNNINKNIGYAVGSNVKVSQPFQPVTLNINNTFTQLRQVPSAPKIANRQTVSETVIIDLDEDTTEPIPSTSTFNKEIAFSLRVKTLSELNTLEKSN